MLKLLFNSMQVTNCLLMILFQKWRGNPRITLKKEEGRKRKSKRKNIKIKRECLMSIRKDTL